MEPRRVLVAYITRSGYTRIVARAIAQRLRDRGIEAELADLELCLRHPERYDAVVLGCAVRHHRHAEAMAEFIAEHRDALTDRITGFFAIDTAQQLDGHTARLLNRLRWHPTHVLVLRGTRQPLFRELLRNLRGGPPAPHPTGEWPRITAFADELASRIQNTAPRADQDAVIFAPERGGASSRSER